MEKYIVSNIGFNSKNEIKEKIQEIKNKYQDYIAITGNDLEFMMDILKNHYNFQNKSFGMTDIYFAPHKEYKTRCTYIAKGNKNMDIKKRPSVDISIKNCLRALRKPKPKINGSILNFGKYKGKTVEEVCDIDRQYLEWILKEFKEPEIKTKVKKQINMNNTTNTIQTTMNLNYNSNKNQKRYTTPIAQYDISGNLIRTYTSGLETAKEGYNPQCVSKCVNNKMKLHNGFIFKKITNTHTLKSKIDTAEFIKRKNHTDNTKNDSVKEQITIQPKGLRIGMFNKQKQLIQVFTHYNQIIEKFGHSSGVFDHLYGRIKTKSKIKNGYNDLYFFRNLNIGQTYTIGEKYDLKQFEKAKPRTITKYSKQIQKTKLIPKVENITTNKEETIPVAENKLITIEELKNILTPKQPKKKNFIQRLIYLFTGQ